MTVYRWLKEKYAIEIKNKSLMEDAFTHASYLNETNSLNQCYERLEFMGDAVVEIWVSEKLFKHQPQIAEGQMTTMRAQLVCEKSLADFNRKLNLGQYIKLGIGEEKAGARNRNSLLADIFESFIGAVYLDCGMEAVNKILTDTIDIVDHPELTGIIDYKTKLQEYVQADSRKVLKYALLSEKGPSNDPTFEMGVYLDEVLLGTGLEHSKKKAEQLAAKEALGKLVK
ncbi:MAG: ribonuclease III [Erysipelotrichia bacterium]|nr:ribonuclease III [Erysipelotrichia bacterium]